MLDYISYNDLHYNLFSNVRGNVQGVLANTKVIFFEKSSQTLLNLMRKVLIFIKQNLNFYGFYIIMFHGMYLKSRIFSKMSTFNSLVGHPTM